MKVDIIQFEDYLRNKGLMERTIENYLYYFNKFTYESFNQETVSRFLAVKSHRNSIGRSFLINFQKFLILNYRSLGILDTQKLEIAEVELPKLTGRTRKKLITPISQEHIHLIERNLESESLKLQLLLTYYCGLRLGELLKISILSFNWEEWKKDTSKMGECRVYGKGNKEGIALVPSDLMKRIARFVRGNEFKSLDSKLFLRETKGKVNLKNRGRMWEIRLKEAGIKAGITKKGENGEYIRETIVYPHRLRHSYAHYLLNVKKLNMREVQELLRHSSIQSTQIYTHINKEDLKRRLTE